MKRVVVFGCGNMGSALVLGAHSKNSSISFLTYTPSATKAAILAKRVNGQHLLSLENIPDADFYLIACKPQSFSELSSSLRGRLKKDALVVSVMVGITTKRITEALGVLKIIRTMPNTPTKINSGATGLYSFGNVSKTEREFVDNFFKSVGETAWLNSDEEIDLFGAMVGAAPAYFYNFLERLVNEYVSRGLDPHEAERALKATFIGSAKLLESEKLSPRELREQVTSKRGVTEAALNSMEQDGISKIITTAIDVAVSRAKELQRT